MMNSPKTGTNSTPTKSVLGKGLASLLPGNPSSAATQPSASSVLLNSAPLARPNVDLTEQPGLNRDRQMGISLIPIEEIKANEFQPRRDFDETSLQELAQSIRENGLIQPLIVRKNGDQFELIAGERRLRASKIAGLKMIPVVIRRSTDKEALELAIVENIQREDLNCVDEGLAYFQLMQEFQLSQEELSKRMGKDRATIANALRVLKLSDAILVQLKKGALSRGHAKALLSIEDIQEREKISKEILEKGLSVRQTEKRAQDLKSLDENRGTQKSKTTKKNGLLTPDQMRINQLLTRKLMTKVELKGDRSGMIQIHYSSIEEMNRLISILMGDVKNG